MYLGKHTLLVNLHAGKPFVRLGIQSQPSGTPNTWESSHHTAGHIGQLEGGWHLRGIRTMPQPLSADGRALEKPGPTRIFRR